MHIDENTPGSVANEEAVRVLKGWLLALYMVDCLVCVIGALGKSFSISYGFWLLLKSLFFSYFTGILLLFVAVGFFGRVIGITKVTPVGILKYCVLLACISVVMGGVLVYQASPTPPTMHRGRSDLKYRDARQVLADKVKELDECPPCVKVVVASFYHGSSQIFRTQGRHDDQSLFLSL